MTCQDYAIDIFVYICKGLLSKAQEGQNNKRHSHTQVLYQNSGSTLYVYLINGISLCCFKNISVC